MPDSPLLVPIATAILGLISGLVLGHVQHKRASKHAERLGRSDRTRQVVNEFLDEASRLLLKGRPFAEGDLEKLHALHRRTQIDESEDIQSSCALLVQVLDSNVDAHTGAYPVVAIGAMRMLVKLTRSEVTGLHVDLAEEIEYLRQDPLFALLTSKRR